MNSVSSRRPLAPDTRPGHAVRMILRRAVRDDLPQLVALLFDDTLGTQREQLADPLPQAYVRAFEAIDQDPNQLILVGEAPGDGATAGPLLATLQLTFIQGLTFRGGQRAQIEAVRVRGDQRGRGIGERLLQHALHLARQRGCVLAQLSTDRSRVDAVRFYQRLGFLDSHHGMKLRL